ncbi:MAG TPA: hypothetical protein VIO13_04620 [Candidatus Dormibacteraeota bacterium]|jgi:hypothetical protein
MDARPAGAVHIGSWWPVRRYVLAALLLGALVGIGGVVHPPAPVATRQAASVGAVRQAAPGPAAAAAPASSNTVGDPLAATTSHLPWGWFAALAALDLLLVVVLIGRRLRGRPADRLAPDLTAAETLILCSGWWVPRSRARALRLRHRVSPWNWPVHREPVRRFG